MRALIDKERLVFLHVHDSATVLSWMMWLEHYDSATSIQPIDHPSDFDSFTDFELRLLYKHTTGSDHSMFGRDKWLHLVYETALKIEPLKVNINELEAQMLHVQFEDEDQYRYVPGSRVPLLVTDLYTAPAREVKADPAHEQRVSSGALQDYPAPVPFVAQGRVSGNGAGRGTGSTSTARTHVTAPRGGVRQVIWDKADTMWNEAGNPTDLSVVLKLRKQIMDALEADGVKRTSSSNELGNWQKNRLSSQ